MNPHQVLVVCESVGSGGGGGGGNLPIFQVGMCVG